MGSGIRTTSSPDDNPEGMTCPGGTPSSLGTPTSSSPSPMSHQQQQHHQMNMMINGAMNTLQLPHQPKKRGRKKKSEMILTPEECVKYFYIFL